MKKESARLLPSIGRFLDTQRTQGVSVCSLRTTPLPRVCFCRRLFIFFEGMPGFCDKKGCDRLPWTGAGMWLSEVPVRQPAPSPQRWLFDVACSLKNWHPSPFHSAWSPARNPGTWRKTSARIYARYVTAANTVVASDTCLSFFNFFLHA